MDNQKYDFTTYDSDILRGSLRLANSRLHDIFERIVPGLFPKELDPKEVLDCVSNLYGLQFDRDFDDGRCDYRIRVSFEGASNRTPEIGVFLGLDGMDNWSKRHRVPLSIISNYPKFKEIYGENYFENPRLRDVLLGGMMNMYGKTGEQTEILMLTYLTQWILCGPLFNVFWRTRSFDIHVPMQYKALAEKVKLGALSWTPSLNYYAANEVRIAEIRESARVWRKTSKSCIGFGLEKHSSMQNLIGQIKQSGGVEKSVHIPLELGFNPQTRQWEYDKMKQLDTDELLRIIEDEKPAFAIEGNIYSDPLDIFYVGQPSPLFLLRRMDIPFWQLFIDVVEDPTKLLDILLAKQITGSNTVLHVLSRSEFASQPGIFYFPICSLPREFDSHAKTSSGQWGNFVQKLNFDKPRGILLAYNMRRMTERLSPLMRKIMCMSALYRIKVGSPGAYNMEYSPMELLLLHSARNGGFSGLPFKDYASITNVYGVAQWATVGITYKLSIIAEIEDICERNSIPCRVHSSDSWEPSGKSWCGYIAQDELNKLGSEGWIKVSAYSFEWGAPPPDVHGGVKNGFITLYELGKYPNEEAKEIMKVFCYEREDAASLENCITRAMSEPHTVYDAILRVMGGVANNDAPSMNPETTSVVANVLRNNCAEPVFSNQQVSDMMIRACYENVPDDIKQKLKSRELAAFIRSCNLNDLCEEAVTWGASRRYIRYMREFLEI